MRLSVTISGLVFALCGACARPGASAHDAGAGPHGAIPVPHEGVVVDKVVAFVSNRPITLSDCEVEVRLERAIAGNVAGALGPVRASDLAEVLPELVNRAAILRGLKQNYEGALDPRASKRHLEQVKASMSPADWKRLLGRLEMTEDDVEEQFHRMLESQAILVLRLKDSVRPGRKEIDAWLASHPGASREKAEAAVAAAMQETARPKMLADARRTTNARVVDPIVAPPEGPGIAVGASGAAVPTPAPDTEESP